MQVHRCLTEDFSQERSLISPLSVRHHILSVLPPEYLLDLPFPLYYPVQVSSHLLHGVLRPVSSPISYLCPQVRSLHGIHLWHEYLWSSDYMPGSLLGAAHTAHQ